MAFIVHAPLRLGFTSSHGHTFANATHEIWRMDTLMNRKGAELANRTTGKVYVRVYVDKAAWASKKEPLAQYHFNMPFEEGRDTGRIANSYLQQAYFYLKRNSQTIKMVDSNTNQSITTIDYTNATDETI